MARASGRSWRRGSRPVGAQRGAARIVRSVFRVPALVTPHEGAPRATRRWRLAEGWAKRRVGEVARSSRDFWRGADRSARGEGDTRGDARDWVESHLLISEQRAGRFWTSARARAPPCSGSRGPQPRASGPATGPRSTPHPGASMFASASADEPSARLGSRRRDARRATRRRCHPPRRVTPSIPCERPRSLAWVTSAARSESGSGAARAASSERFVVTLKLRTLRLIPLVRALASASSSFAAATQCGHCLLYTSPSPRDATLSRMPSSA